MVAPAPYSGPVTLLVPYSTRALTAVWALEARGARRFPSRTRRRGSNKTRQNLGSHTCTGSAPTADGPTRCVI